MSVYLYDESITEKLREIISDRNVHIITPEKMFTKSKDEGDNPEMPAVSLTRTGWALSNLNRTQPGYMLQGRLQGSNSLDKIFSTLSLPIDIHYQCDVWTRTREQNDELCRELIMFFTLFPEQVMHITYKNFEREINFNVFLEPEITDNSDINEFENRGQYYRSSFNLIVDEAQLFVVKEAKMVEQMNITLESYTKGGDLIE